MQCFVRLAVVLVTLLESATHLYAAQAGHLTQLTFEAGSATINPGALPEASVASGPCTRTTSSCASGTGCYRWNPTSQICYLRKQLLVGQPVLRAAARFRVSAFPSGFGGYDFFALIESAFATGVYVGFSNGDQLSAFTFGSGGASSTCGPLAPHLSLDTWYALRLRAQKSDDATVSLDLLADNGSLLDSVTCTNLPAGGGSFTNVQAGSTNGFTSTADIRIDDIDVHTDAAWPGNVRWTFLEPTGNASCGAAMTGCSGSGNQWQCVDENPPSDGDTTYLTASTTSVCRFNHPTVASKGIVDPIHGGLLWWDAKKTSGTVTLAGRLNSNDVGAQVLTSSYADFFSLNTTNPATAAPWLASQVGTTTFGFRKTTAGTARVSASRWIIGYEAPTPVPTPTPVPALYDFSTSFDHPAPTSGDAFGDAVAIAAGYVAVGVASKRQVYVYDHATGLLLHTISSPNGDADLFGLSVAGVGEDILVGAPRADTAGVDSGTAYLYDGVTGALLKTFRNPSPAPLDNFGVSVAAVSPYVLIGADGDDTQGTNAGAAYLFDQNDPAPIPTPISWGTFYKPPPIGTSAFGSVVGAVGPYAIVGDAADTSGAGVVFGFDANFWSGAHGQLAFTLRKAIPVANDAFGSSVTNVGGMILVGAPGDDTTAVDAGAAYLFDDTGALQTTFANPSPAVGDQFGAAVASARGVAGPAGEPAHAVVGAPFDDGLAANAGAVYLFDRVNATLLATLTSPQTPAQAAQSLFGAALDGGRAVLVGAPEDSSTFATAGRAYWFERGIPFCADSEPDALIGAWSPLQARPAVAVHSVVTSTGTVQFFQGAEWWYGPTDTFVWNPATGALTQQTTPSADGTFGNNLFCAGHSTLEDGRTIVIGGTVLFLPTGIYAIPTAFAFDPITETWAQLTDMSSERWYPTATTLGDGRVLAIDGTVTGDPSADTPEVYNPATNTWSTLPSATIDLPLYPHMFQLPNGKVFQAGADGGDKITRTLDVGAGSWMTVGSSLSSFGSSAMYEPGKVMKSGGMDSGLITQKTGLIDMTASTPAWTPSANMTAARQNHTLVVLPDGSVLAVGGRSGLEDEPRQAVLHTELWKPSAGTWTRGACMAAPRMYHSSAVLLPDGRVLSQGGDNYPSYQVYTPPYLYGGTQPTIDTAPGTVPYGQTFVVQSADAATITGVVFMRPGAATHGFDENQRRVPLAFTKSGTTITVTAPSSGNTAPPGYYMLFLVNASGVPSEAKLVQLSGCHIGDPRSSSSGWFLFAPAALLWGRRRRNRGVLPGTKRGVS